MGQEAIEQLEGGGYQHEIADSSLVTFVGEKEKDQTMEDAVSGWSELLPELLELIAKNITRLEDQIRFSVVSKSWYSCAISNFHTRQILLMLSDQNQDETRSFFRLYDRKTITIHLPKIHKRWCRASSLGWLITFDENTNDLQLFNPFLNRSIQLPSMQPLLEHDLQVLQNEDIHNYIYVVKFALSSDPIAKPHDCVITAIYSFKQRLAFCRLGDEKWTALDQLQENEINIEDVIFYKHQFYALREHDGPLVAWNVLGVDHPQVTIISRPQIRVNGLPNRRYMVDSCGELLMVVRFVQITVDERYVTVGFEVYKLQLLQEERWTEVKCLGDQMLFLGDNCSMSLSASDFPKWKRNCIYFTDDYWLTYDSKNFNDVGVFDLEEKKFVESSFYFPQMLAKPAMWIVEDDVKSRCFL